MTKLNKKKYKTELEKLQVELVKLQAWVKHTGARIIVVFEGRDAAGKGGIIKRIIERVSPRVFRVAALPIPSDREKSQFYLQRYVAHLPSAGEVVLFDRSWYNRAGIEHVLGFCTDEQYQRFIHTCGMFEKALVDDGIILIKYWLTVSHKIQIERFTQRIEDPLKQWKLSPTDLESVRRWYDYSRARDAMFDTTDTPHAPWYIVKSDVKRKARLNCIRHLLDQIPYEEIPVDSVEIPERDEHDQYDDVTSLHERSFVHDHY